MHRYRLTTPAQADLDDIYRFTLEKWGVGQADAYFNSLFEAFGRILVHPHAGTNRSEFGEGIQFVRHQSHKIFYRVKGDVIEILAIPHIHQRETEKVILRADQPKK